MHEKHGKCLTKLLLSQTSSEDDVIAAMPLIERYTSLIYKRTTYCFKVNDTRRELFVKEGRDIGIIPPTQASLMEHVKKAAYVAGYVRGQTLERYPIILQQTNGAGRCGRKYAPCWTKSLPASLVIRDLIKCGYHPEKGCLSRFALHRIV